MTQRADLLQAPQAEKKVMDKACLYRKLHICVCSPTGKDVLRMTASLIAKLKLRARHLRGELLVPLDADAAAASGGELFGPLAFLEWLR